MIDKLALLAEPTDMRLKPCLDEVHELGAAANSPRAGGGSRRIVAEIRQTAKSAGRDWERGRLGDWEWRREGGEEWLGGRCSCSSGHVLLLLLLLILILILLLLDPNSAAPVHSASFAPPRFNVFRSGCSTRYFFLSHPAIAAAVPAFVASGTLCTSHTRINADTSGSCG